jgi:hypothetical protein
VRRLCYAVGATIELATAGLAGVDPLIVLATERFPSACAAKHELIC